MLQGASTAELKAETIRGGMQTPAHGRHPKILEGMTTPEEVLRITVGRLDSGRSSTSRQLLKAMVDKGASRPPHHRRLAAAAAHRRRARAAADRRRSTPVDTKQLCYSVLTDAQKLRFEEDHELDFSFGVEGLARFRANVYMQRGASPARSASSRIKIIPLEELGLPPVVTELCEQAARPRARHRPDRLGQVDDARVDDRPDQHAHARPHHHDRGSDRVPAPRTRRAWSTSARSAATRQSFKRALKYILRQDPDVVLVGEMRDLETIEAALTIAETGHLCFATLHTNSAVQTHQPHHRRVPAAPAGAGARACCRSCSRA